MEIGVCSNCEKDGPVCSHCWKCSECCECEKVDGKKTGGRIANGEKVRIKNK
ncbi:MAG: hypothetical protein AABX17_03100 [Nanoarchaeota archaeon]